MASYIQILSEQMIKTFPMRIINVQHSFLPAFPGGRHLPPGLPVATSN